MSEAVVVITFLSGSVAVVSVATFLSGLVVVVMVLQSFSQD